MHFLFSFLKVICLKKDFEFEDKRTFIKNVFPDFHATFVVKSKLENFELFVGRDHSRFPRNSI